MFDFNDNCFIPGIAVGHVFETPDFVLIKFERLVAQDEVELNLTSSRAFFFLNTIFILFLLECCVDHACCDHHIAPCNGKQVEVLHRDQKHAWFILIQTYNHAYLYDHAS